MTKLKAPKNIVSVSYAGTQYDVDADECIDAHQDHVAYFIELGFTDAEAVDVAATGKDKAKAK